MKVLIVISSLCVTSTLAITYAQHAEYIGTVEQACLAELNITQNATGEWEAPADTVHRVNDEACGLQILEDFGVCVNLILGIVSDAGQFNQSAAITLIPSDAHENAAHRIMKCGSKSEVEIKNGGIKLCSFNLLMCFLDSIQPRKSQ